MQSYATPQRHIAPPSRPYSHSGCPYRCGLSLAASRWYAGSPRPSACFTSLTAAPLPDKDRPVRGPDGPIGLRRTGTGGRQSGTPSVPPASRNGAPLRLRLGQRYAVAAEVDDRTASVRACGAAALSICARKQPGPWHRRTSFGATVAYRPRQTACSMAAPVGTCKAWSSSMHSFVGARLLLGASPQISLSRVFASAERVDRETTCLQFAMARIAAAELRAGISLVVEMLLLPHPATKTPPANAATSHVDSSRTNGVVQLRMASTVRLSAFSASLIAQPSRSMSCAAEWSSLRCAEQTCSSSRTEASGRSLRSVVTVIRATRFRSPSLVLRSVFDPPVREPSRSL